MNEPDPLLPGPLELSDLQDAMKGPLTLFTLVGELIDGFSANFRDNPPEGFLALRQITEVLTSPAWLEGMKAALERFFELLDQLDMLGDWAPPNWRGGRLSELVGDGTVDDLLSVMRDDGITLVYVPRRELVHELLQAADRVGRVAILLDRQSDVVADCRTALTGVDAPRLEDHVRIAQDLLTALEHQSYGPAQSHAANLFDRLLRDLYDRGLLVQEADKYAYWRMRTSLAKWADGRIWEEFRTVLIILPIVQALQQQFTDRSSPMPETFNRHATVHSVTDPRQVNPGNAIIAAMLVVSMLCDIQEEGW